MACCRWGDHELGLYFEMQRPLFSDCVKLSVAADPSSYSGEKALVSVLYSAERQVACFCPVQVMPASKYISPADLDMHDRLLELWKQRKLERVAAFRDR